MLCLADANHSFNWARIINMLKWSVLNLIDWRHVWTLKAQFKVIINKFWKHQVKEFKKVININMYEVSPFHLAHDPLGDHFAEL